MGTAMLFIHGGALDDVTCRGAKPRVGWGFLGWKRCWVLLLPKRWKSGAFCAIELTQLHRFDDGYEASLHSAIGSRY